MNQDLLNQIIKIDLEHFPTPWNENSWRATKLNKLNIQSLENELKEDDKCFYSIDFVKVDENLHGVSLFQVNLLTKQAHLLKIIFKPIYQNHGLAKKLLLKNFEVLRKIGVESVFLEVEINNIKALGLYNSLGFKKLNVLKKFYSNKLDAYSMILYISN